MPHGDRDERLLRFLARYKVATVDILARLFFEGLSTKAVERVLGRLRARRLVRGFPLVGRQYYYALTAEGARCIGVSEKKLGAGFGVQALIQHYSILLYCRSAVTRRDRMLSAEFREHFPELARGRPVGLDRYYLDLDREANSVRLVLMLTDMGSHPRRLIRKCRRQFHVREEASVAWKRFIGAGLFRVVLLTAYEGKAKRLQAMLEGEESLRVQVEVVPGLAPLLTSAVRARAK